MKKYTLLRIDVRRGILVSNHVVNEYQKYQPTEIIEGIATDAKANFIPRVMISADALYGTMEKRGRYEVARQHKFTAPKTYIVYYISVEDCTI